MYKISKIFIILLCLLPLQALSAQINITLMQDIVNIDANFKGISVQAFGSKDSGDIVIIARGPEELIKIRTIDKLYDTIWVTKSIDSVTIPSYHTIHSSKKLNEILNMQTISSMALEINHISMKSKTKISNAGRELIIKDKEFNNSFGEFSNSIINNTSLFKATIFIPPIAKVGMYTVAACLIQNNKITACDITPLFIKRVGFAAFIYNLSINWTSLYAITSVLLSMSIGAIAAYLYEWFYQRKQNHESSDT